jgi:phage replication O-like protein O
MKLCSPQLEKGHTRIANELLEAIMAYPFNATELKLILVIIRKTYGWKKKSASISYGLLAKLTGRDKRYIRRTLNRLIRDRVILKEKTKYSNILGLNKYYLQWKLWITLKDRGEEAPNVGANSPSGRGYQTPENEGVQTPTLNKERNIYKESSKEKSHLSTTSFKKENFREYLKEPIHIEKLIKEEFGEEVRR